MPSSDSLSQLRFRAAYAAVLVLWLVYTLLQTWSVMGRLTDLPSALLGLVPGVLSVAALLAVGLSPQDLYLRVKPLSARGLYVLAAVFAFALVTVLPVCEWQGWSWAAALVYAPLSGVAQELFFRSALLPTFERLLKAEPTGGGRRRLALLLHAALFGLWHIGPLFIGAPLWAVLAVMFVPFLSGLGWGWQVQRDRTVVWAMIQHSLFWVIGLQFAVVS